MKRVESKGETTMLKRMDHAGYPASLRSKSDAELHYTIRDAREAADALPLGPNAGYYLDEISYAAMELQRRRAGR
jgi:hypothetical protein